MVIVGFQRYIEQMVELIQKQDTGYDDDIYCPTWLKQLPGTNKHDNRNFVVLQEKGLGKDTQSSRISLLISQFISSEREYYENLRRDFQELQNLISNEVSEKEQIRFDKMFLKDMRTILGYQYRFQKRIQENENLGIKIGTLLNDTMFIHENYKQSIISMTAKSRFKKKLLFKIGQTVEFSKIVEYPIERMFAYRSWLKQLVNAIEDMKYHDRGKMISFEVFEVQLALIKVNKILEAVNKQAVVDDWTQSEEFDKQFDNQKIDLVIGKEEAYGENIEPETLTMKVSSDNQQERIRTEQINLLQGIIKQLNLIKIGINQYIQDIAKFVRTQLDMSHLWYRFFSQPLAVQHPIFNGITSTTYTYESFIKRWEKRQKTTKEYLLALKTEILDKVDWLLAALQITDMTSALQIIDNDKLLYEAIVVKWLKLHKFWLKELIGTKGVTDYQQVMVNLYSNSKEQNMSRSSEISNQAATHPKTAATFLNAVATQPGTQLNHYQDILASYRYTCKLSNELSNSSN